MLSDLRRAFRNASIRSKLLLMAFAACATGVVMCCMGFVWSDLESFREAKHRTISAQAKMLAFNSSAVIAFNQTEAGTELLSGLSADPSIERAALFNIGGDNIAQWQADASHKLPLKFRPDGPSNSSIDDMGHIRHVEPIVDGDDTIGFLLVCANTTDLERQLAGHFWMALLVMFVSIATALLIAWPLQRIISQPIVELAAATALMTEEGNFSLRVEADRTDELGTLYQVFNAMLDRVELGETALREINDQLESRVQRRTQQLQEEIRQREATHQQLIDAKELAEQANLAKSQFLANMSHEIRTPMNAVLGFSELLQPNGGDVDEEEQREYVTTIHNAGKHLMGLINDILDLTKIEAGKMEIELLNQSPHKIISEAMSVMRVPARKKNLSLDYAWSSPIPATIVTDPARLRQLLINLIGNAIKFTMEGGVTVLAELVSHDDENMLKLEVVDTGIGISIEKQQDIFHPFAQADSSTTRRFGGTGLGLTISRRIAESLGGSLSVSSAPGQGSVFTALIAAGDLGGIPILSTPPVADIVDLPNDVPDRPLPQIDGGRVLLVEDGDTNRRMIQLMLRRSGIEIDTATNGQIGIDMIVQNQYDVVLMDMQMPVKDGYDATSELRSMGYQIPIIALTAHAMKGDEERCRAAGCSDYLTKPIGEERLIRKLSEYLPRSVATDETQSPESLTDPARALQMVPVRSCLNYDDPDYREIIENFKYEVVGKVNRMRQMACEKDYDQLRLAAHWLKGTGGTAGFDQFTIPAVQLRRSVSDENMERIDQVLATIEGLIADIE